ncbi:hypothetical protein BFW38_07745 [Terasakiispira papahanaumokuakeensis]|uniref:Uncharacterized protein n=1 Tax=Terasakiispira papahanaumokuakeensis TaxID=197479 RepID=A0A1E2V9F7_9GAMM|nr:hypothetical protein [Terasakiispira papahanaumokuakeensis]ODC03456.1 hypothetical protein BFW38_07745 [Terasakiispira papahanaumokuakeensis]
MAEQDQQQEHHAGSCEQPENKKIPSMTWWLASPGLLLTIAGVIGSASHIGDNAYCAGAILLGGLMLTVALCLHKKASWSIDAELKSSATFILIIGSVLSLALFMAAIVLFPLPFVITQQGIETFFNNGTSIAKVLAGGAALAAFYATMHRSSQTQKQLDHHRVIELKALEDEIENSKHILIYLHRHLESILHKTTSINFEDINIIESFINKYNKITDFEKKAPSLSVKIFNIEASIQRAKKHQKDNNTQKLNLELQGIENTLTAMKSEIIISYNNWAKVTSLTFQKKSIYR